MSAWPEAVYIIKQIQNALGLNQRVLKLENRLFVFAPAKSSTVIEPDLIEEYDFSNDSVWFVENRNNSSKIYAVSVYSETQGWSSLIHLSPDSGAIDFTPATGSGILANVDNVEDALNTLAVAVSNVPTKNASKTSKGVVQIGANIDVSNNGEISVPNATTNIPGVIKLFNRTEGNSVEGTLTQSAIRASIGRSSLSYESVVVTGWSNTKVGLSGRNIEYYTTTVRLSNSYGEHPTISLGATSPYEAPTPNESAAFKKVDFITVSGNDLTLYARFRPESNFTITVKV